MTSRLELILTSNIFQQQGRILPSTLSDSIWLRVILLVQLVDNPVCACLSLLTSAVKENKRLYKIFSEYNQQDATFHYLFL